MRPSCEVCVEMGGFDGDPIQDALYRLTVTAPENAVKDNPAQNLCLGHAAKFAEGYLGYGWAVSADLITEEVEPVRFIARVVVECESKDHAEMVLSERLGHDEDYGFEYRLDWFSPVQEGEEEEVAV